MGKQNKATYLLLVSGFLAQEFKLLVVDWCHVFAGSDVVGGAVYNSAAHVGASCFVLGAIFACSSCDGNGDYSGVNEVWPFSSLFGTGKVSLPAETLRFNRVL
eukprot:TRINITY_DN6543_c0_g2_i1.p1 TRINITY_DN6543_c0_g2~~TRINITY_DN6543_c0_g2_i1.p1  ORF type:complete len:103 (-),score=5.49 TRINITY_DN6543_c0_g2_i1:294-602(-)